MNMHEGQSFRLILMSGRLEAEGCFTVWSLSWIKTVKSHFLTAP